MNFDWNHVLKSNILTLKIVGLWPTGDRYTINIYTIWALVVITIFNFGHNFFQTINMMFIFDNLHAVVQTFYVTLSELLALLKAFFVIKNIKIVKHLLKKVQCQQFQPRNNRQIRMIAPGLRFWKANYILCWSMSLGAIFFWSVLPILDNSSSEYPLPFLAWYPWNTKTSPLYELTYAYQIFGLLCVATTAISTDALVTILNVFSGAQFDILCDNIRYISFKNNYIALLKCIKHHKMILEFARQTNLFSNWIMLGQICTSAVTIGITLFQMTVSEPYSSEFFSCISFTFSMVIQIFMYCWFSNEVEIKSQNLIQALYDSPWILTNLKNRKILLFFFTRAQKNCKISAGNLFYLSLGTFMKILRTAWSYFALLHQIT